MSSEHFAQMSGLPLRTELDEVFRQLFESAGEGLLLIDRQGIILLANRRAEEMLGYDRGELLGLAVDALVPASVRGRHGQLRDKYHAKPQRRSMGSGLDLEACRKDGSLFPVEISLNTFQSGSEELVMAFLTDITQRKRAELELEQLNAELEQRVAERTRELKESQRLYSLIARNFPNGAINVFDANYDYVFVDGRGLRSQGLSTELLIGTNYLDRLDPELAAMVKANLDPVFDGHDRAFQFQSGSQRIEMQCVGLRSISGEIHQILVVEHDITQIKQAEEDIRKMLEKEKELNELKSRFVSMASHEFRTPLSTILSSVSLCARYSSENDAEKRAKHIARIRSSVHNLTGILNDFLSLDRLEAGGIVHSPKETEVLALLEDVAEEMQAIAKPQQRIVAQLDGPALLNLDGILLRNILVNLVSNAIKYSPEGSEVRMLGRVQGDRLQVSVHDQGIGIPDGEQLLLFQRFFRAKNATNIQGTGLGLTIVQKYLDLMGGDISFESKEGVGSTFTITLPLIPSV